jgi:hypothetical protein
LEDISYTVTICSDASESYPNSSVILKQGTTSAVLGRYNDTYIIGRGMEIRPSEYIAILLGKKCTAFVYS